MYVEQAVCEFADGKRRELKISGIGKYPYVVTEEDCLDFGDVVVGQTKERPLKILNQSLVGRGGINREQKRGKKRESSRKCF